MKRGRKRTPYKDGSVGRRRSGGGSAARRGRPSSSSSSRRRESSLFFSRVGGRRSLVDPDGDDDGDGGPGNDGLLPFSVTIDPGEYTSPSSTSVAGNSVSTLGTPAPFSDDAGGGGGGGSALDEPGGGGMAAPATRLDVGPFRNSLDSACVSPGSLGSSLPSSAGRDAGRRRRGAADGGGEAATGRETPKSARSSSSTILRAVHHCGALLPGNSPQRRGACGPPSVGGALGGKASSSSSNAEDANGVGDGNGRLRPNQLKYSPSSSIGSGSGSHSTPLLGGMVSLVWTVLFPDECLVHFTFLSSSPALHSNVTAKFTSPSYSDSTLSSDIMSLFTHQSLDNTGHYDSKNDADLLLLGNQLSIFSEHPAQPFHISICDLMQWSCSSTHRDKELLEFTSEVLSKGLSPSTMLSLIVDAPTKDDGNYDLHVSMRSMIDQYEMLANGTSRWLQSAVFGSETKNVDSSSIVQRRFESILSEEIQKISSSCSSFPPCPSDTQQGWSCNATSNMIEADLQTISSSIQKHYNASCMHWSRMEVDVANRALIRLRSWAESIDRQNREIDHYITTTCGKKLMEFSALIINNLDESTDLRPRKRRAQSRIDEVSSGITSLEDQLAVEVDHLERTMRAKRLLDAHLNVERFSPISALNDEIRTFISPCPIVVGNGLSQFSFSLLNGSAEIVLEISSDDYEEEHTSACRSGINKPTTAKVLELDCFIKDGGPSIKLLQAILLGNVEMSVGEPFGPYLLRESLSSFVSEEPCSREEIFHRSSLIFSRIDTLVRSVRDLEVDGSTCNVIENGQDITLSILMPLESDMGLVRLDFLFADLLDDARGIVNLIPDDVKMFIISSEVGAGTSLLRTHMQEKARSMIFERSITSSSADPILLKRICKEMQRMLNVE